MGNQKDSGEDSCVRLLTKKQKSRKHTVPALLFLDGFSVKPMPLSGLPPDTEPEGGHLLSALPCTLAVQTPFLVPHINGALHQCGLGNPHPLAPGRDNSSQSIGNIHQDSLDIQNVDNRWLRKEQLSRRKWEQRPMLTCGPNGRKIISDSCAFLSVEHTADGIAGPRRSPRTEDQQGCSR